LQATHRAAFADYADHLSTILSVQTPKTNFSKIKALLFEARSGPQKRLKFIARQPGRLVGLPRLDRDKIEPI
jgi:hypothetical protein